MSISDLEFTVREKRKIESFVNSGQLVKARKTAEKLCRKQRNDAECWFVLGAVSGQQGDFSRAVECCNKTIKLAPHVGVAYLNLGIALHGAGKLTKAIEPLTKSIELHSDPTAAYRELGMIYNELNDLPLAINAFNELVGIQPNDKTVWLMLGNLHEKQADFVSAERCYRKSFVIDSSSIPAGLNLGNALKALGRSDEAELIYKQMLKIDTNNLNVLFNIAVLYQSLNRYEIAETYYKQTIELQSDHHGAMLNLGVVYTTLTQYDKAISLFAQILDKSPENVDARRSLATVHKELGLLDEAKEQLDIILSKFPNDVKTRQDLALILLQQGDFLEGWQQYEWRNYNVKNIDRWPYPKWKNDGSVKKTVLVYPEQGVGDEVMFSSCISNMSECANVILACDKRLEPLFLRSFPKVRVVGRGKDDGNEWLDLLPHIDSQISIASLPLHFRNDHNQFPLNDNYLVVAEDSLSKWCDRYKKLTGDITVGISWRGGHETNTKFKRSNELSQWERIFSQPNVNFVNLQYGDCFSDRELVREKFNVTLHDWSDSDPLLELDDFAAKIKALDLVVAIDNSTVHIAGAVGTPTWILQPFSPDWRWLSEKNNSYWYQSIKQYRQKKLGNWPMVIEEVAQDLSVFINSLSLR